MRIFLLLAVVSFIFTSRATAQTELTDKKNIVFARNLPTYNGKHIDSMMFDIYYPTGAMSNKKYPVYFHFYAGSFTGGDRTNITDISDAMAENGFIVVATDYRTGYKTGSITCINKDDSTDLQEAIY